MDSGGRGPNVPDRDELVATWSLAALGVLLLAGVTATRWLPQRLEAHPEQYVPFFLALFALFLMAVWLVQRRAPNSGAVLGLILGFGIAMRISALLQPASLSTDIYRYLWDAHVASHGVNPYAYAPAARQTIPYRTTYWSIMNHKDMRTMYPPLSQAFFLGVRAVGGERVSAFKTAFVLVDLVTLATILMLLSRAGLPLARCVVYAWHPLVVMEIAGSGHQDALGIMLMAAALLVAGFETTAGQSAWAGVLVGLSAMSKGYVLPAVPIFARKRPALFAATAALAALPFIALYWGGGAVLVGLSQYMQNRLRNAGPFAWLDGLLAHVAADHLAATRLLCAGLLLLVVARMAIRPASGAKELAARCTAAIGTFFLLSHTVYPWYATWLVPGLCLSPSLGWLAFTGLVSLAYLNPVPHINPWVPNVEYGCVLALLAWEGLKRWGGWRGGKLRVGAG